MAIRRQRQLAEAAAGHFHRLGFHGVALADVAASVGVTAPAVYRHYRNKNALLAGAIATGLDHVEDALDGSRSLDEAIDNLAEAALARRDVWALLQREIRHLDDRDRRTAVTRFGVLVRRFTEHVRAARPGLDDGRLQVLTTAAFAVLASPSTRPLELPHETYRAALYRLAGVVCATDLPPGTPTSARARRPRTSAPHPSPARGEEVLRTAITLFHRHGYAAVSMDDIGAAVGIAGPSIYHHFPTKAELLLAAYERAASLLPTPGDTTVDDLVERYATLAVRERELFGVYATEEINLPAAATGIREAIRADEARWVAALRHERPGLDAIGAELLVHAARSAVQDLTRVGRLHARPGITAEIVALARAILAADLLP